MANSELSSQARVSMAATFSSGVPVARARRRISRAAFPGATPEPSRAAGATRHGRVGGPPPGGPPGASGGGVATEPRQVGRLFHRRGDSPRRLAAAVEGLGGRAPHHPLLIVGLNFLEDLNHPWFGNAGEAGNGRAAREPIVEGGGLFEHAVALVRVAGQRFGRGQTPGLLGAKEGGAARLG